MGAIDVTDAATLVPELRAAGLAEKMISGVCYVASRVFRFVRRCGWQGENPFLDLERGERPKDSPSASRTVYEGDELSQVIAAALEPWRTLFRLASVVGAPESELLGLSWEDLGLVDLGAATIRLHHCSSVELNTATREPSVLATRFRPLPTLTGHLPSPPRAAWCH